MPLGLERDIVDPEIRRRAVERFAESGVRLPRLGTEYSMLAKLCDFR